MGEMICVKDLITGNQYESIRLASQMTKVPESKIRKFVDEGKPSNYKGKVYLFKKVLYGDKSTKRGHFRRSNGKKRLFNYIILSVVIYFWCVGRLILRLSIITILV